MRAHARARSNLSPDCLPDSRCEIVIELVANVRERRSLPELARHLDLSPSRLEHLFKSQTGISIRTFAINLRLHRAAAMLRVPDVLIKTVLYETGFNHPANFSHLFRKHFGVTATRFKANQSSGQERPIDCACQANARRLVQLAMRLL